MDTDNKRLIGLRLHTPKKDRAYVMKYYCEAPEGSCPLLEQGECIVAGWLTGGCIYGYRRREDGWTPRAKKYHQWIKSWEGKIIRLDGPASERVTKIGEWWWLPYAHMNMYQAKEHGIPFYRYDRPLFGGGAAFINDDYFTVDVIQRIMTFKPEAVFGGEITSYQKDEVPKFLRDLRTYYPEIFKELVAACPEAEERAGESMAFGAPLKWFFDTHNGYEGTIKGFACHIISEGRYVVFEGNDAFTTIRFPKQEVLQIKIVVNEDELFWPTTDDPRFMKIRRAAQEAGVIKKVA